MGRMGWTAYVAIALAACLFPACEADLAVLSRPSADGGLRDGGDAAAQGDVGVRCGPAMPCPADLTCDIPAGRCVTMGCTTHAHCGRGSICGAAGTCTANSLGGPCVADGNCLTGETCTGGFCGCGGTAYGATLVPPNVLIVLDKSGSMRDPAGGGTGMSKWAVALGAVGTMLATYGDGIYFGLKLFAGPGSRCDPGAVLVDPAPMTAGAINARLLADRPGGATPLGDTLQALVGYGGLQDVGRENYLLLMTDGNDTCGGDGVAAVTALRGEVPEVRSFVVGFGAGVDPVVLDAMAVAGGTARAGAAPSYYQADDAASLAAAFGAIAGRVLSCTYVLTSPPPPDARLLSVYFGTTPILPDPTRTNGWDYDPSTGQLTFHGPACEILHSGWVTDLVISYGCPGPG